MASEQAKPDFEFESRLPGDMSHVQALISSAKSVDEVANRLLARVLTLERELAEAQRITNAAKWYWNVRTGENRWTPEACRILGADPMVPPTYDYYLSLVHPDDRADLIRQMEAAIAIRADIPCEYRVIHPDGTMHYLKTQGNAHVDARGDLIYFGVMVDVTETKAAQARLKEVQSDLERVGRIATLGEFAASIAHELSQPLLALVCGANAASRWLDQDVARVREARACVERLRDDATRALSVVKHLRNLMTRSIPSHEPFDLGVAAREVVKLMDAELGRQHIRVRLDLEDSLTVTGDPVQIQQVMLNLLANAIDAMRNVDRNHRRLSFACAADANRTLAVVRVSDTGVGMPADLCDKIFQPFFSTKENGMGMGLAICKSIVEVHEGTLRVESIVDVGTTFEVRIPMTA